MYVSDTNFIKKRIAKKLDLNFINFNKINNLDCIINTTSNYDVLNNSFTKLNLDGKIIEVEMSYLQLPAAAANAVILLIITLTIVYLMTKFIDIRKEL